VLTVDELAARIEESFEVVSGPRRGDLSRHESLAATVAWTLANLDDDARELFGTLGVFARPAALVAIQAVAASDSHEVLDALGSLLDFSLVQRVEEGDGVVRFGMPEALHRFAVAELDGRADAAQRYAWHADHVARVLREGSWLVMATAAGHREAARIGADASQALEWARQHDSSRAAAIAAPWSLFLADQGRLRESRPLSQSVVDDADAAAQLRAQALFARGITAMSEGRLEDGLALGEEAVGLAEGFDRARAPQFLALLAGLRGFMGDTVRAVQDAAEAVERAHALGDAALAGAYFFESQVRLFAGDTIGAEHSHRRALELGAPSGAWILDLADNQGADLALAKGQYVDALAAYLSSLDSAVTRRDDGQITFDLSTIADCLTRLGRYEAAAEVVGMLRAHAAEAYGTATFADQALDRDGTLGRLAAALTTQQRRTAEQAGRDVEPGRRPRRVQELSR
jgi:tetratricopeptide (TPR) repeat protein